MWDNPTAEAVGAGAQQLPPPPPAQCTGFYYTVRPGDTLFFIAQRFGTTVAAILAANPQITNPSVIFVGQVICIPARVGDAPQPPFVQHLMELIGSGVVVATTCGALTGILANVFSDHILVVVDGIPFHTRIDAICWVRPAPPVTT